MEKKHRTRACEEYGQWRRMEKPLGRGMAIYIGRYMGHPRIYLLDIDLGRPRFVTCTRKYLTHFLEMGEYA